MAITLYYRPGAASFAPRVVLEELGEPYDLSLIERDGPRPAAFLAISPARTVPALQDGEVGLSETVAVLMHLADRFRETPLGTPRDLVERAAWYRWLMYLSNTLMPTFYGAWYPERWGGGGARAEACVRLAAIFDEIDAALGASDHLVGDRLTMPDIVLGMLVSWCEELSLDPLPTARPNIARAYAALQARPSVVRVNSDEGIA